ncbi:MAG TPA: GGDEF domain-containing protein [Edaphobacter sp.]|nr:GGDEF domain-containing protein [Edaphobacter sp.]
MAGTMDATTLVLANVLLFALCAGVMLLNARAVGGMRGAAWFAGANLCRGSAMLILGIGWLHAKPTATLDLGAGVLSLAGLLMLHQSFAALLERRMILRLLQIAVSGVVPVLLVVFWIFPVWTGIRRSILLVALALLTALVAVLVLRYSEEEARPLGWFTGFALTSYALVLLLRGAAIAFHGWSGAIADVVRDASWWLLACLITTAATAFGFMSLSATRLRVELLWRAQVDDLTGLLNRWALKRTALKEIQHCRRTNSSLAVVMLDLDGLKGVNDTRGHTCGDIVLQAVGSVLQETVRARDSVARIGGDEFCVILPDSSVHDAIHVAERLREEIYDLVIRYRGDVIQTRASLGVASSDTSGLHWQNLVDDSDSALYEAKRSGKNRVVVARSVVPGHTSDTTGCEDPSAPEVP